MTPPPDPSRPKDWQRPPAADRGAAFQSAPALTMRLSTDAPVTLLHAPAGFGKSVAMRAEYARLATSGIKAAWIAGEALALSGLSEGEAIDALRELIAQSDVLFLDDPDRLPPALVAALTTMILYAEAPKRLVAAIRRIADLPLARRIAQRSVEIIGGELLALPRRRFAALWERNLSPSHIRAIHDLTEGWPAPSQMIADWLAQGGEMDDAGLYLSDSHVAEFIDREILAGLPGHIGSVITATALHHEIDQPLLDRLSPDEPVRQGDLVAALPALVGRGSKPGELRYNALLRRHLQLQFDRWPRAQRVAALRTTSDWAAGRDDVVSAAYLASAAGDGNRIVELTTGAGGLRLWLNKGYDTIRTLVGVAGEALIETEPRLQLLLCIVLLKDGRIGDADRLFRRAIEKLPPGMEAERDAAIVESTLLIYGCRAAASGDDRLFRRLAVLCADPAWNHLPPTIQAIRHSQQAEFGAAMASISESIAHARAAGSSYQLLFLDLHIAGVALARGALTDAAKALTRARRRWRSEFATDEGAETVMAALSAQLDFERGRVQQAKRHLKSSAHRLPHSEAWLDIYVAGFEPMMRLLAEEHGPEAAAAAIARSRQQLAMQSLERIADLLSGMGACIAGEAWLFDRARPASPIDGDPLPPTGPLATWQEQEFGSLAAAYRALIAGDPADARKLLDDLVAFARERGLDRTLQRALLLQTAASDLAGDPAAGERTFEEAVAIARRTGLRRAFCEIGGPSVADRLIALQARGRAADSILKGLQRARLAPLGSLDRKLTRRERQVLDELVIGGSDKAIARRLGITEHGVRFHLKNVYAKLGVHDRAGAVNKQPHLPAD